MDMHKGIGRAELFIRYDGQTELHMMDCGNALTVITPTAMRLVALVQTHVNTYKGFDIKAELRLVKRSFEGSLQTIGWMRFALGTHNASHHGGFHEITALPSTQFLGIDEPTIAPVLIIPDGMCGRCVLNKGTRGIPPLEVHGSLEIVAQHITHTLLSGQTQDGSTTVVDGKLWNFGLGDTLRRLVETIPPTTS